LSFFLFKGLAAASSASTPKPALTILT
jgi:hypothetical protein